MRVVVVGLGVSGAAVVADRRARGDEVLVVDDAVPAPGAARDPGALADRVAAAASVGAQVLAASEAPAPDELVAGADLVVPSPGVPERHPLLVAAARAGVVVRAEIDLAAEVAEQAGGPRLVAVTGTNGKTTVTTLTAAMLVAGGVRAVAAGNIGRPLLEAVADDVEVVVAEVSSFQLAFTRVFHPRAAALLNFGADHLDWHRTFEAYVEAKARIFERQRDDDVLVFGADDPVAAAVAARAPARRVPFSTSPQATTGYRIATTAHGRLLVDDEGTELIALEAMARRGATDVANALAAAGLARSLGVPVEAVASVLADFEGLAHRTQRVATIDGITYVDDSKATNPHATIAAVRGFERVVLIAGGRNKGLDLTELRGLALRLRGVVAIGEAQSEVVEAFAGLVPVERAGSMVEAVAVARRLAAAGDTVLLSPACASFDWYPSYAARGDEFTRIVTELSEVGR